MTVISSKIFSTNPIHYLNLAITESVAIKRGKILFQITPKFPLENPSPSDDPYFANPENVAELEHRMEEIRNGKVKFRVLSPERQKELFEI
ncbi:MAG: hypothetical protein FWE30_00350 [Bacteroidales bacterium]|nr:hypothetical protein [Bacteroidales bacterium]